MAIKWDQRQDWLHLLVYKLIFPTGHTVAQIKIIFRVVLPRHSISIPALDQFLTYVHRYKVVTNSLTDARLPGRDPVTGLYHLKMSRRASGDCLGDVIPLSQIRVFVHLAAKHREKADNRLTFGTSIAYSNEVWLNSYFDKETFYSSHCCDE